jgi:hypothetical protein
VKTITTIGGTGQDITYEELNNFVGLPVRKGLRGATGFYVPNKIDGIHDTSVRNQSNLPSWLSRKWAIENTSDFQAFNYGMDASKLHKKGWRVDGKHLNAFALKEHMMENWDMDESPAFRVVRKKILAITNTVMKRSGPEGEKDRDFQIAKYMEEEGRTLLWMDERMYKKDDDKYCSFCQWCTPARDRFPKYVWDFLN